MEKLDPNKNNLVTDENPDTGWGEVEALADKQDFDEASPHDEGSDDSPDEYEGEGDGDSDEYTEDDYDRDEDDSEYDEDDGEYGEDEDDEDDEDDYDPDDYDDDYDDDYEEYHDGDERLDVREDLLEVREIPLPENILKRYDFIEKLPENIAVVGGVARSVARELLTGEREPIRDIDLVELVEHEGESTVDPELLVELSQTYMPDDFAHGHGVRQEISDCYFLTRDFTINQCLIKDGKLLVSNFAENDFKENIIRPTYYELQYDGDKLSSRLFLKALMLRTVVSQISKSIPLLEDVNVDTGLITAFEKALFLNKAMSRSVKTAIGFTEDLADWGVIDQKFAGRPVALAKDLMSRVYSFEFRPSTDERFIDVKENHDMNGFFIPGSMNDYYASDPVIARAMAEYDDADPNPRKDEPSFGHYTQAHYDAINSCAKSDDDF